MNEKELRVGFVFTGSFCTYDQVFPALAACKERFGEVIPILSNFSAVTDTRFAAVRQGDRLTVVLKAECLEQIGQTVTLPETETTQR